MQEEDFKADYLKEEDSSRLQNKTTKEANEDEITLLQWDVEGTRDCLPFEGYKCILLV